jgi:DNA-binding transcriptional LysR family regulator
VSQHIRALEEHLGGIRLFRRVGQRMVPTHAGEELLQAARELVMLVERMEQNMRALKGQVSGRVTIGCTASSGEYLLAPLLRAFRTLFPAVGLTVQVASGEVLLEALNEQQITLVLIEEQQRRRGWESSLLGRETLLLLTHPEHPLLHEPEVQPGLLREYPLVLPSPGTPLRRVIEDGLRRRGVSAGDLHIAMECDSVGLMIELVRDGLGLAFVPQTRLPEGNHVGQIHLAGTPLQQEWYVLRARQRGIPRAAQEFYSFFSSPTAQEILVGCGLVLVDEG